MPCDRGVNGRLTVDDDMQSKDDDDDMEVDADAGDEMVDPNEAAPSRTHPYPFSKSEPIDAAGVVYPGSVALRLNEGRYGGFASANWPLASMQDYRPFAIPNRVTGQNKAASATNSALYADHYRKSILRGEVDHEFDFGLFGRFSNGLTPLILALSHNHWIDHQRRTARKRGNTSVSIPDASKDVRPDKKARPSTTTRSTVAATKKQKNHKPSSSSSSNVKVEEKDEEFVPMSDSDSDTDSDSDSLPAPNARSNVTATSTVNENAVTTLCDYITMVSLQYWTLIRERWMELDPQRRNMNSDYRPPYLLFLPQSGSRQV